MAAAPEVGLRLRRWRLPPSDATGRAPPLSRRDVPPILGLGRHSPLRTRLYITSGVAQKAGAAKHAGTSRQRSVVSVQRSAFSGQRKDITRRRKDAKRVKAGFRGGAIMEFGFWIGRVYGGVRGSPDDGSASP